MQELFIKKERESIEKMNKFPNYQNNGYLDTCLKRKEMNKVAHVFLQLFPSLK